MLITAELDSLDHHFGEFIARLSPGCGGGVYLAAALASLATRGGHACLNLSEWPGREVVDPAGIARPVPGLDRWLSELAGSPAIGGGDEWTPLVLENDLLYLRRYWEYETEILGFVRDRAGRADRRVEPEAVAASLERLFPVPRGGCDRQRLAALAALLRTFVAITGGPGTGKTTAVARLLALFLEHGPAGSRTRIALAAPTGKAVMRLQEVMLRARDELDCPAALKERMPVRATTLHRLLGPRKGSPYFRHGRSNLLPYDLVVVDEASMVDLPLMAKLVRALHPETGLVIVGDRGQLASVEPGAVLGDLCREGLLQSFSSAFLAAAASLSGDGGLDETTDRQADSLVELTVSHRFGSESGIGLLSRALAVGDADRALEILESGTFSDVTWRRVADPGHLAAALAGWVGEEGPDWLACDDPAEALGRMGRSQLLCALRHGRFGAAGVNRAVEKLLAGRHPVEPGGLAYQGRPVMVARNDYDIGLYNGDTGIIMSGVAGSGHDLRAFFPDGDGGARAVEMSMLPPHETVYAMTVHKSQGSEFDEVAVILPDRPSPVLSRELLYTAATRARQRLEVWGTTEVLRGALEASVSRRSGLRDRLERAGAVKVV